MFKSLLARAREVRAAELEGEGGLEAGFTLIELMVVLLIIAILLAIAIPTFLGVSGSAKDRAAQSNLTTALTDTIAFYQNTQSYDSNSAYTSALEDDTLCSQVTSAGTCTSGNTLTSGQLKIQEPSYSWTNGACTSASGNNCISVVPVDVDSPGDGQGVILGTYSANKNTCWYVMNLQANPSANSPNDTTAADAFDGVTGNAALPANAPTTAGTYYAYHQGVTTCSATTAETYTWGSSYSSAGAN